MVTGEMASAEKTPSTGAAVKFERYAGNPILSPNPANAWESLVTTNPGAWYDEERGEVNMLYRAAGHDEEHVIHFGLARSKDGFHFERASDLPVFSPSLDGFDAGCVEDPRIVKMGEWYYVTYAARPFHVGKYWGGGTYRDWQRPAEAPLLLRENATSTGLAMTRDFKSWIRAGRLSHPLLDDRDVILFPEKVGGKFVMLHRPCDWVGPQYGTEHPAIWISSSEDLLGNFGDHSRLLAKAQFPWECKIGGSTPPIKTAHGWLTIYHAVGPDKYYRLGAFLLDLDDPSRVLYRTRDWLMQPEADYEIDGFYEGVVFPCGNVVIGDTLFLYYGGADRFVGVATCPLQQLIDYLLTCPVD